MKVLITGGYGFVGSHVANHFHREGCDIVILDNLRSGVAENVVHKHRFYHLDTYDRRCEEIFKNNAFDAVIHMAAQVEAGYAEKHGFCDTKSNILGLVNMLSLSSKYKVKKFIFASSMAVYSDLGSAPVKESHAKNPDTVFGMNKLLGEYYCSKWHELYGIDAVSVRLGYVYGPRQNDSSEGSVVSIFFNSLVNKRPISIYGDGEQRYDFVYVGDIASAIYKLAGINYSGVLNLGSGVATSINTLVSEIEKHEKFDRIVHMEKREEELDSIRLDTTLASSVLDWVPETSFEEGIAITLDWFVKSKAAGEIRRESAAEVMPVRQDDARHKSVLERYLESVENRYHLVPLAEVVAVFALITFINIQSARNYAESPVDLNLFAIILFSALYGSKYGIYAFILSVVSTVATMVFSGRDPLVLIYNTDFYLLMAYYVFVAFIIGYIKDKLSKDVKERDADIEILNERLAFTNNLYRDMRNVRDELQSQIVNTEDSFGKIFSIVQELNTLKPDEVFAKAIIVLERLMKTNQVAIYRFNETSHFARVMAASQALKNVIKKSIRIEETPELVNAISQRELVVNRSLSEGSPVMIMPVFDDKKMVGAVMLFRTEFENLTLSYQNYFKVITELVASALSRAYAYDDAIETEKYLDETSILKPEYFEKEFKSKLEHKQLLKMDFVIISIQCAQRSLTDISQKVDGIIRDTDCLGQDSNGDLILLLGNTNLSEAGFVMDRLAKLGLEAVIIEGDAYDD